MNAGLLWMSTVFVKDEIEKEHELDDDSEEYLHHLFREAGGVSLLLTIANVILIIVSSMLVMRIKERLPIKKRVFWDVSDEQRLVVIKRRLIFPFYFFVGPSHTCGP